MKIKKLRDYNPQPVTRLEKIWAAIAGLHSPAPEPVKRLEYWMTKTAERIAAGKTVTVRYCNINVYHHNYIVFATLAGHTATGFEFYALSGASRVSNNNYVVDAYIEGRVE